MFALEVICSWADGPRWAERVALAPGVGAGLADLIPRSGSRAAESRASAPAHRLPSLQLREGAWWLVVPNFDVAAWLDGSGFWSRGPSAGTPVRRRNSKCPPLASRSSRATACGGLGVRRSRIPSQLLQRQKRAGSSMPIGFRSRATFGGRNSHVRRRRPPSLARGLWDHWPARGPRMTSRSSGIDEARRPAEAPAAAPRHRKWGAAAVRGRDAARAGVVQGGLLLSPKVSLGLAVGSFDDEPAVIARAEVLLGALAQSPPLPALRRLSLGQAAFPRAFPALEPMPGGGAPKASAAVGQRRRARDAVHRALTPRARGPFRRRGSTRPDVPLTVRRERVLFLDLGTGQRFRRSPRATRARWRPEEARLAYGSGSWRLFPGPRRESGALRLNGHPVRFDEEVLPGDEVESLHGVAPARRRVGDEEAAGREPLGTARGLLRTAENLHPVPSMVLMNRYHGIVVGRQVSELVIRAIGIRDRERR